MYFETSHENHRERLIIFIQVNDPAIGSSLGGAAANILKQDGLLKGFYSGFVPVLFKQIPYTMAKFAVQG